MQTQTERAFRSDRLDIRQLFMAFVAVAAAITAIAITATPAQAAPAPRCYTPSVYTIGGAGGGCDGFGGGGHDRLVVQCNGARGNILYVAGSWMHRAQSWYYRVWCPGGYGYRAKAAWYEHVGW
jgi:hypothetical protein